MNRQEEDGVHLLEQNLSSVMIYVYFPNPGFELCEQTLPPKTSQLPEHSPEISHYLI